MRGGKSPLFSKGETYEMLAVRQRGRHRYRDGAFIGLAAAIVAVAPLAAALLRARAGRTA
jgi:hypothetical protein